MAHGDVLYDDATTEFLEALWGDGFLSPGGPEEVARILAGLDLAGRTVLDVGCGSGGITALLVRDHGAARVFGIDVEAPVCAKARRRAEKAGLADRIEIREVRPGPFPVPDQSVDLVFSKDSIVHIPDKHTLMRDVFRVLKPGGWFVASDWLIGHDNEPSQQMKDYIASEGLDFGMASPGKYKDALEKAGFRNVTVTSRNAWYRERARQELETLSGPLYAEAVSALGQDFVDHNITIWQNMIPVLDSGEHCPTHLRGFKPKP